MSIQIDYAHVDALKRSIGLVGKISTILVDQNGRELAGRHRSLADPDFTRQVIEVKNPYHRELIILLSNIQRQLSEEELKFRMNKIAMEYWVLNKCKEEEVCSGVCKDLAPENGPRVYSQRRIEELLEPRWKLTRGPKPIATVAISPNPEKLKEITTALNIQNVNTEDPYPFKDCHCNGCPHTGNCY